MRLEAKLLLNFQRLHTEIHYRDRKVTFYVQVHRIQLGGAQVWVPPLLQMMNDEMQLQGF